VFVVMPLPFVGPVFIGARVKRNAKNGGRRDKCQDTLHFASPLVRDTQQLLYSDVHARLLFVVSALRGKRGHASVIVETPNQSVRVFTCLLQIS